MVVGSAACVAGTGSDGGNKAPKGCFGRGPSHSESGNASGTSRNSHTLGLGHQGQLASKPLIAFRVLSTMMRIRFVTWKNAYVLIAVAVT